jgi:hypothetical protein
MTVQYSASDDFPTQGLGIRIHYNSKLINYVRALNVFEFGLLSDILIKNDVEDFDKDNPTDKIIVAAWSFTFDPPFEPFWSLGPEPTKLFDIEYTAMRNQFIVKPLSAIQTETMSCGLKYANLEINYHQLLMSSDRKKLI